MVAPSTYTGIVNGKSIELDRRADGSRVSVTVHASAANDPEAAREALIRAFVAWSDDPDGVQRFLEEVRRDRDATNRREIPE